MEEMEEIQAQSGRTSAVVLTVHGVGQTIDGASVSGDVIKLQKNIYRLAMEVRSCAPRPYIPRYLSPTDIYTIWCPGQPRPPTIERTRTLIIRTRNLTLTLPI
jgi:hypothetical protein